MGTPPHKQLPSPVQGFADPKRRAASTAAFGEELGRTLTDDADVFQLLDDEPTRPHAIIRDAIVSEGSSSQRAVLEPVSDDAHPIEHRRVPTQPELLSEALAAVARGPVPEPSPDAPTPTIPRLISKPMVAASSNAAVTAAAAGSAATSEPAPLERVPEPMLLGPNRSPSPVREAMGLFSSDRITNLLAGAAIGLLLAIVPAQRFARAYARDQLTQPLLELADAIDHPLAVDADLLRTPQAIAAEIEGSREAVRTRYLMIWLLAGLPIGLGLGFIPRWWS